MRVIRGFASVWLALAAIACVQRVGVEGRPCPCATQLGFACCESSGMCVASEKASAPSCRPRTDAATDGSLVDMDVPAAACPEGAGRARLLFFSEREFGGRKLERPVTGLSFDWGDAAPGAGFGRDGWSAIVRGQLQAEVSGDYTFRVRADQGVSFWLAGQPRLSLMYRPVGGHPIDFTVPLLGGRKYELVIHYTHETGPAYLDVRWQPPGRPLEDVPACALYPDSLYSIVCPDGDQPCRQDDGPTCPRLEGLGLEGQFFAGEDFTRPLYREASLGFGLNWGILVSEFPALIDTRAIRFQGKIRLPRAEPHTFYLTADPAADIALTIGTRYRQLASDGSGVIRELALEVPAAAELPITVDYVMRVPPERSFIDLKWQSDSLTKRETSLCYLFNP